MQEGGKGKEVEQEIEKEALTDSWMPVQKNEDRW